MSASILALWSPLVGGTFAKSILKGLRRVLFGCFVVYPVCFIGAVVLPFAWDSRWVLLVDLIFVVGAGVGTLPGSLLLVRTSREMGALLRARGVLAKKTPPTFTVIAYRRWLKTNDLTEDQVLNALADAHT